MTLGRRLRYTSNVGCSFLRPQPPWTSRSLGRRRLGEHGRCLGYLLVRGDCWRERHVVDVVDSWCSLSGKRAVGLVFLVFDDTVGCRSVYSPLEAGEPFTTR